MGAISVAALATTPAAAKPQMGPVAPPSQPPQAAALAFANDASPDDIYRQLFGAKAPPLVELAYPVVIDGVNQGDALIRPGPTPDETEIKREAIISLILPYLTAAKADELAKLRANDDRITAWDLLEVGITARFDRTALVLVVDVPDQFRTAVPIALQRRSDPTKTLKTLPPEPVSAYVNIFSNLQYVEKSEYADKGLAASSVFVDGALNIRGAVLQGGFEFSGSDGGKFSRSDVNLTYDLPSRAIRLEAGDLTAPVSALQGSPDMAGLSAYRNFDLRPYEVFRPTPSQEFRIDRPARVAVYINGQFVREFRLTPGRYNLTDLPLRSAAGNDIALEIRYDSGDVQRLVFAAFFDFNLLKEGVSEFSFNAGFPFEIDGSERRYDTSNPAFSGFYRRGITSYLTLGLNAQVDKNVGVIGGEALVATGIGSFGVLAGYNARAGGQEAGAASVFYRWNGQDLKRQATFDLLARVTGEDYLTLSSEGRPAAYEYDVSGRFGVNLRDQTRLQMSTQIRQPRGASELDQAYEVSLTERARFGMLSADLRHERTDGKSELSGRLTVSMPIGPGVGSASYESRDRAFRAVFNKSAEPGVGGFGYEFGYTNQIDVEELLAAGSYNGNRFDARVQQRVASGAGGGLGKETSTSATLGTAIVFAGGHVAMARPVVDSFAIFDTRKGVGDFELAADPQGSFSSDEKRYSARSSALGPAVVPDLNAYLVRTVEVEAPDAPAGVSVGSDVFVLKPTFRSGYYLQVGSDRNISMIGRLVDSEGKPIAMAAGYVVRDGEEKTPIFTNAGGRFYLQGLKAGETVRMQFESPMALKADLLAPKGVVGMVRLDQPVVAQPAESFDGAVQTPTFTTDAPAASNAPAKVDKGDASS